MGLRRMVCERPLYNDVEGYRACATDGEQEAVVQDPRLDTVSREVFRHQDLADAVRLERVRDHFLCKA